MSSPFRGFVTTKNPLKNIYKNECREGEINTIFNSPCFFTKNALTILTGKSCVSRVSLNSVKRMAGWLLLIFFICLHNELRSIHSNITYLRVQMFEKCDPSNRQ